MAPRRPTAPHAGAARTRAVTRPVSTPRPSSARGAPAGRSAGVDRPPSSGRASSRPAAAAGTPAAGLALAGRGRAPLVRPVTMLSAVLVALVLLLAPYVRPWVNQRSQIAQADEQMHQLQQQVAELSAERRRWDDPAYVRAQARERLHFVMPGETGYVVLDDSTAAVASPDPRSASAVLPAAGSDAAANQPWYAKVWSSVRIAGDPTTEQARSQPGTTGTSP